MKLPDPPTTSFDWKPRFPRARLREAHGCWVDGGFVAAGEHLGCSRETARVALILGGFEVGRGARRRIRLGGRKKVREASLAESLAEAAKLLGCSVAVAKAAVEAEGFALPTRRGVLSSASDDVKDRVVGDYRARRIGLVQAAEALDCAVNSAKRLLLTRGVALNPKHRPCRVRA